MDKNDILYRVKQRPGFFLGSPSLKLLQAFINGYSSCVIYENIKAPVSWTLISGFQKFVEDYFEVAPGPLGYIDIILRHYNDEEGFYKFFELLESYHQLKS